MGKFIGYRENSRVGWGKDVEGSNSPDPNDIQLGCLLRIADATEAMAKEHNRLLADLKWQREAKERAQREADRLARSNAALRGVIARMKRKATGETP